MGPRVEETLKGGDRHISYQKGGEVEVEVEVEVVSTLCSKTINLEVKA
jgi:hypothetical protein